MGSTSSLGFSLSRFHPILYILCLHPLWLLYSHVSSLTLSFYLLFKTLLGLGILFFLIYYLYPSVSSSFDSLSTFVYPPTSYSTTTSNESSSGTGEQDVGLASAMNTSPSGPDNVVNNLHSIGVSVDNDLPVTRIIGNASAGKSSLLESISRITHPHARGATEQAVGLSNAKMSASSRRMLDLINSLHSTGVSVDIDLPVIAVIGNQSAGKSSLIESISGITLPRAAGTCTRCPTECHLSSSTAPWKCIVTLCFTTDSNGQQLGRARHEIFGPPIYASSEVQDRIRRAQRAILNPEIAVATFLNERADTADSENALTFSVNYISLQISGPGVADLSFVDLPGLIVSVSRSGSPEDIQLVQSLVIHYIRRSNCIILLTVACETDFENQGAQELARRYDPDGKRTIGVLTKPDRIPLGEEEGWVKFIRNEKESLENNWYCVKQPSSNDLKQNPTWAETRKQENNFFSSTSPWSELGPMYQKYLCTMNLLERLSSVLSDLIAKRLPEIQGEVEQMISRTRRSIDELPKGPPDNALNEVVKLIKDFDADLKRHVEGSSNKDGIIQLIRPSSDQFRRQIRDTAPQFRPYEKDLHLSKSPSWDPPSFLGNEEDAEEQEEECYGEDVLIYVDEVYRRAQEARSRELPGNYPFAVQREYIDRSLKKWHDPSIRLCDKVFEVLIEYIRPIVHKHFGGFGSGQLENMVGSMMKDHLMNCRDEAERKVNWILRIEHGPATSNTHYLADYHHKFLTHYRKQRARQRSSTGIALMEEVEKSVREALDKLAPLGFRAGENTGLLPTDEMESALDVMARVRAYFQVAYKRFTDIVPMAIDYELVQGGNQDVFHLLWAQLNLASPDAQQRCEDLARESPQIAVKREELIKKLERLGEARKRLMTIASH